MADAIPRNVTAQLLHHVRGNPPTAHLESSVSNYFPGLEFDLRGLWAKMFEAIALHETRNVVRRVEDNAPAALKDQENAILLEASLDDPPLTVLLTYEDSRPASAVERGNAFAELMRRGGDTARCRFLPRPFLTGFSSMFETQQGRTPFLPAFATDGSPSAGWVSEPKPAATGPQGGAVEFLEWDFGEDEAHQMQILRMFLGSGLFNQFQPRRYRFRTRLSADEPWQNLVTQQDATPDNEMEGWIRFDFQPLTARFVRLEILELAPFQPNQFLAAIGEVQFDEIFEVPLRIRPFFGVSGSQEDPVVRPATLKPGELTQSLCSPWQHDYRDCVCFYWASSRPDFVNIDEEGRGHNWTDEARTNDANGNPEYRLFESSTIGFSYKDLFESWETRSSNDDEARKKGVLRFQIDGKDE